MGRTPGDVVELTTSGEVGLVNSRKGDIVMSVDTTDVEIGTEACAEEALAVADVIKSLFRRMRNLL